MIVLRWLLLIVVSWCVDLLGLAVVPVALLFCNRDSEHLPAAFWPWDNARAGINGDAGWRSAEHANGDQRAFRWRFVWLVIRNPGNNFGYWLGIVQEADTSYRWHGDKNTSDQGHPGWLIVRAYNWQQRLFGFGLYAVWRYPFAPDRCLRIRAGWKLNDMMHDGSIAEIVAVVNPVMPFREG